MQRIFRFFLILALPFFYCEDMVRAESLDLWQAYELARENDTRYRSSVHEGDAARTYRAQGLSGLLPNLSARGSFTHSDSDRYNKYETRSYSIALRQPLFNLENYYQYRRSGAMADAGDVAFFLAEADMKLRLAEAYFTLLASKDREGLLEAERQAMARQLEQTEAMQAGGLTTLADVHEARSLYLDVISRMVEAKSDTETHQAELERIIGRPVTELAPLASGLTYGPPEFPLEDWRGKALSESLVIRYREHQANAEKENLHMAVSRYAPSVDLMMQYMDTNESTHYRGAEDTIGSVGVHLYWPLYSGGGTRARHLESRALAEKALSDLEGARRETVHRVTEAYTRMQGASARVASLEETAMANEVALESSRQGVRAGIRTPTDVLNAERRLYDSRTRLLQARYDHILSRLSLLYHSGDLQEEDMRTLNGMLDPAQRGVH